MPEKGLTVGELIRELQRYDPELPVRFSDYEHGYQDVVSITLHTVDRVHFPEGEAVALRAQFIELEGV